MGHIYFSGSPVQPLAALGSRQVITQTYPSLRLIPAWPSGPCFASGIQEAPRTRTEWTTGCHSDCDKHYANAAWVANARARRWIYWEICGFRRNRL